MAMFSILISDKNFYHSLVSIESSRSIKKQQQEQQAQQQ
jgi:hypothetical protein